MMVFRRLSITIELSKKWFYQINLLFLLIQNKYFTSSKPVIRDKYQPDICPVITLSAASAAALGAVTALAAGGAAAVVASNK